MIKLRFRLLGEPQIWYGDVRLDKLLSRKQLALLVFLVCEGATFRRERLATLLWGECGQSQALYNLRRALCQIAKAMRSIGLERWRFLILESSEIQFAPDAPYSVDIQEPGRLGPFLGTFTVNNAPEFEEWVTVQRAAIDSAFDQDREATMAIQEDVLLVKLGLGAMAAAEGDGVATAFYTRMLKQVAETPCREFDIRKVKVMKEKLELIRGIGKANGIQLLAQLGWFVSQLVDSGTIHVVY